MIEHGGLANLARWHRAAFGIGPADRIAVQSAVGFDALTWEVWAGLTAGAALVLFTDGPGSPRETATRWARAGVTVGFLPTPLAEAWLREPCLCPVGLRLLLTGGERLQGRPPVELPVPLVNNYGPSETTVVATSGEVAPGMGTDPPSIGRAIANVRVDVLDASGRPVPLPTVGEIVIGGAGVGRGYWKRPGLTAERFVPDPAGPPGARRYRTGDRGRRLPDGDIDFYGRTDDQVQVHGVRIELGEVERALLRQPGVTAAVVVAPGEGSARRVVAYVTGAGGEQLATSDLRRSLAEWLPASMIPAAFVVVERIPIGPNGKLDRSSLPAVTDERPVLQTPYVSPRTRVEAVVQRAWSQVLGIEQVGVHDDFLELGGHSLHAIELAAMLGRDLGLEIPLRAVLESRTIAGLVERMTEDVSDLGDVPLAIE
jgi:acyl-coenzyme A synthetase/AMP-(fatty) acid ligase